ncbi:MAG: SDR family oxidoreductase [Acidobacteriales bacterium]|nr:SDR family oxidoreductase [Terriglobales bacterium]
MSTYPVFHDSLLTGKVAVITGGGSGINLGITQVLARHGAKVALLGRSQEKLDAAVAGIAADGGTAMGLSADVRDYARVEAAFQQVRDARGEIDIVICGAAGNFPAPALGMSANGFKAVVDIDVLGTFNTCRAAYTHLRKPGASIVNISAPQAFIPMAYQAHVCAAKAGVDMITKTLAIEWGPAGVRVNSVVPGPIDETEGMKRLAPTPEARERVVQGVPLKRLGQKQDIADLVLFLCTPAASFIHGAVLVCDGGQSLLGAGTMASAAGLRGEK